MKKFNTTAVCTPTKHYMVDISDKVKEIKALVDSGAYFTINRARQYGKTTTLFALKQELQESYVVISLDFQKMSHANFETERAFIRALAKEILLKPSLAGSIPSEISSGLQFFWTVRKVSALQICFFVLASGVCCRTNRLS